MKEKSLKLKDLLFSFVFQALLIVFTPLLSMFGSYLLTGDYLYWVKYSPSREILSGLTIVCVIIALILIRRKQIKPIGPFIYTVSRFGYEDVGYLEYLGVKWRIKAPLLPPWNVNKFDLTPSRIEVGMPRCPKCETEIEQIQSFWFGYVWKCPNCDFKKKSKESYSIIKERAEKVAKRWVEMELQKDRKK